METWKSVVGFEGAYEVSSLGNIRILRRSVLYTKPRSKSYSKEIYSELLKPIKYSNGYLCARLIDNDGKPKIVGVHRVVAEAFLINLDNKPHVNHLDANRGNNCAENLEWCTPAENVRHTFAIGRGRVGENHPNTKLSSTHVLEIRESLRRGIQGRQIAKIYGVSDSVISSIKTNRVRIFG